MDTVFKYSVPVEDYFSLDLPKGARIFTVQTQYSEPQLWALVDKEAPLKSEIFDLLGLVIQSRKVPMSLIMSALSSLRAVALSVMSLKFLDKNTTN